MWLLTYLIQVENEDKNKLLASIKNKNKDKYIAYSKHIISLLSIKK